MPPLTHFLCLPLTTPSTRPLLETSLHAFKSDFLSLRPDHVDSRNTGVNADTEWCKAIRPVGTLHLTLGVMSLTDNDKLDRAIQSLKELDTNAILMEVSTAEQAQPFKVSLRSLRPMQKASDTSILYAVPHDPSNRLLRFCERLKDIFVQHGFMVAENRPLKLHATIANTIYAKLKSTASLEDTQTTGLAAPDPKASESNNQRTETNPTNPNNSPPQPPPQPNSKTLKKSKRQRPIRFDARPLLNQYRNFEWAADITLDRISICEMGAKKVVGEDGQVVEEAYKEVATNGLVG